MSTFKRYNGTNWETIGGGIAYSKYSTTEHVVGTWVDGKPVYEKQISGVKTTFISELNEKITNLIADSKILNLKEKTKLVLDEIVSII